MLSLLTATTMALLLARGSTPTEADASVRAAVADVWSDPYPSALVVDWFGSPEALLAQTAILVAVCLMMGRVGIALVATLAPWGVAAVTTAVKPLIDRTIHAPQNLAFPSGHTAVTTAVALVIGLLVADLLGAWCRGRRALVALVFGCVGGSAMATAQIALNAHYPSDCLGGFVTAVSVVLFVVVLVDRAAMSVTDKKLSTSREVRGRPAAGGRSRASDVATESDGP
ncbi:phosphatase PAP2 family protein [Pseudonocardia yuanmonensis]|uniref:phosphatase PAP2 family protein n=1 Tax=Pseudonocardia yuanmonensis TaxID=1095914 RepID=UPI0031E6982D